MNSQAVPRLVARAAINWFSMDMSFYLQIELWFVILEIERGDAVSVTESIATS